MFFFWLFTIHLFCYGSSYTIEPKYKCPESSWTLGIAKMWAVCRLLSATVYPCECSNGTDDGLHIQCVNVNMATLSAAIQNLDALETQIYTFKITKSRIARLFGPLFSKLKTREIIIEDTPITYIEDYAFHGVNRTLEKLHLINSNLSSIKPLSFGNLGNLIELNIYGHALETITKDLFQSQDIGNRLEILRITNGVLNNVPIEAFQPLRKLKVLDLHRNLLETLKRNQFQNLRNVETLDLSYNKLKKLEAHHISDMTKLSWFNASNNELQQLIRGTFSRNSVLKVLHLEHNKISSLDVNSFRGMRFLRRLYMNDNNIGDIGRGTFGSITRIGTIDLARNILKKIEFQMFSQLNYVEDLNLAENKITIIEKNAFKDIYQAIINVSYNQLSVVETNAFQNCVNITVLDLSHNLLKNFSRNAFDATTFPNEFQLSYNDFNDLAQIPLQNMTGIKILNASHNSITRVPKNSFPKLYELHTIDLSYNNITFIANGVFQTIFSIRFLNLSHNNMSEVKSSVFGALPTLLEMDLSTNGLKSIVRGALSKLLSLRSLNLHNNILESLFQIPISLNELDFSKNSLKGIPAGTWPTMNSLIKLDVSYNNIGDSLDSKSFAGLQVLQTLHINNNGINLAPLQSLAGLPTLQYLHIENNNITHLEKNSFGKLPVLFELNLRNNGISSISKRAFEGLLQLLKLDVSMNMINNIPNDAFVGLPSLRYLDLSYNRIVKLDNKTNSVFDDLLSLEHLNLSHNNISFVTTKTFPSNKYIPYNLKYLDLSYNRMPVLTYDLTFGTKKLLKLNISHNFINEIRKDVLSNLTKLHVLDLSNNELTNLSEERVFELPTHLTEIYLHNNHIYRMPLELLRNHSIQIIDLRNNNLTKFPSILVSMLKNHSSVLFSGNQLHCSCSVRPLKHLSLEKTSISDDFKQILCNTPSHVSNKFLKDVSDEHLQCILDEKKIYSDSIYQEATDIKFRYLHLNDQTQILSVGWYVATSKDIADITIYIRSSKNVIVYQKDIGYNERSAIVYISEFITQTSYLENVEICIISKDSMGEIGRWFAGQCQKIPQIKIKFKSTTSRSICNVKPIFNFVKIVLLCILVSYCIKY